MPELPEVEVSRQGIKPYVQHQTIAKIVVRQPQLRWLIPDELSQAQGQEIIAVRRRAKYLILETPIGAILIHLGMSGSLRVLDQGTPATKHDHVDLILQTGKLIRYNDPRRFGAWLWQPSDSLHPLLKKLGPEPLSDEFDLDWLVHKAVNKRLPIKQMIMDNAVVVGVGNIYACESLFYAGIHPSRPANSVAKAELSRLVVEIKQVLSRAIAQGGTTLKDFSQADGKPGYFVQQLMVYGRANQPCLQCNTLIQSCKIGQRNTFYCPCCQPQA